MIKIELNRATWQYDPQKQIGEEGGFGAVYKGTNSDAKEVAVKKLTLLAGGPIHREIDMAETLVGRDLKHVVPVLDAGKDDTSGDYFVVMALAEKSLQQDLTAGSTFDENQTINVARHVVAGLLEVGETVLAQQLVERRPAHAQELARARDVPVGLGPGPCHGSALGVANGVLQVWRAGVGRRQPEVSSRDPRPLGDQDRALHAVLELSHVARPGMGRHRGNRVGGEA